MRKYPTAWLAALPVLAQLAVAPAARASLADPLLILDTDDDGVVTTRELEARALERWRSTDLDHDGRVTAPEMQTKLVEFRRERFAARDADGNGVLEQGELADVPEALVARLDVDGSGALSQAELDNGYLVLDKPAVPAEAPKLLPGDANNDGAIVKTEATATARLLARSIDRDGDGRLSAAELAQAPVLRTYGPQLLGM